MSVFSERIQTGNDDGYKTNTWRISEYILETGWAGGATTVLRFSGVTIPAGATITSAYLLMRTDTSGSMNAQLLKIYGIAEDNTATLVDDPTGRTKTSANTDWDIPTVEVDTDYTSPDIKTAIQEIIDRAGWNSGQALGLIIVDDGSTYPTDWNSYEGDSTNAAQITINYTTGSGSASGSASQSPSWSQSPSGSASPSGSWSPSFSGSPSGSPSPSGSQSPSGSASPSGSESKSESSSLSFSASPSPSGSESPSPMLSANVLKIAKSGINVLTNEDPSKFIFSSEYGTLKYYSKQTASCVLSAGDFAATVSVDHNLGYYPYVEVYVQSPQSGLYQYCPYSGAGATVEYGTVYKITTTQIVLYATASGFAEDQTFNFIVFIFKNDLGF